MVDCGRKQNRQKSCPHGGWNGKSGGGEVRGRPLGDVRPARCLEVLRLHQLMDLQGSPFSAGQQAWRTQDVKEEGASKCCVQNEDWEWAGGLWSREILVALRKEVSLVQW